MKEGKHLEGDLGPNRELTGEGSAVRSRAVRHVTLWGLLVWAYRDQRAHRYLRRPDQWFMWAIETAGVVDGMMSPAVHRDAAAVHAAVLELPKDLADRIVFAAAQADQPEAPVTAPEPAPVEADTNGTAGDGRTRRGWGIRDGQRVDYLIRTHARLVEERPVIATVGRGRHRRQQIVGSELVQTPVEYCPLTWTPDPIWHAEEAWAHAEWLRAMRALWERRAGIELRDHVLTGPGVAGEPLQVEWPLLHDARIRELQDEYRTPKVAVDLSEGPVVISPQTHELLGVEARARIAS